MSGLDHRPRLHDWASHHLYDFRSRAPGDAARYAMSDLHFVAFLPWPAVARLRAGVMRDPDVMEGFLRVREAGGSWQRRLPGNPGPASRRAETPWRNGMSTWRATPTRIRRYHPM